MVRHRRGRLQRAAILQIGGDPGRAETVVADRRPDPGRRRAPAHPRAGVGVGQGGTAYSLSAERDRSEEQTIAVLAQYATLHLGGVINQSSRAYVRTRSGQYG